MKSTFLLAFYFCLLTINTSLSAQTKPDMGSYLHLFGTIGDFNVTMNLIKINQLNASGKTYTALKGYYGYEKKGYPIYLSGEMRPSRECFLEEKLSGNITGLLYGNMNDAGVIDGNWKKAKNEKEVSLFLHPELTKGTIDFEVLNYIDSISLFVDNPASPKAYFNMTILWPKNMQDPNQKAFLQGAILTGMTNDTLSRKVKGPDELFDKAKKVFFAKYKMDMKNVKASDPDVIKRPFAYSYEKSTKMVIMWNENFIQSIGYENFLFTGGESGKFGTTVKTYDLTKKYALYLCDLMTEKYTDLLPELLEHSARTLFKLRTAEPITEALTTDKIIETENFCLTSGGILFVYQPNEIASPAKGEIQLFVSFDDLKGVLKEKE